MEKIKEGNTLVVIIKVVANLPYYITSPMIMKIIPKPPYDRKCCANVVQKEVAQRIVAPPGKKGLWHPFHCSTTFCRYPYSV